MFGKNIAHKSYLLGTMDTQEGQGGSDSPGEHVEYEEHKEQPHADHSSNKPGSSSDGKKSRTKSSSNGGKRASDEMTVS